MTSGLQPYGDGRTNRYAIDEVPPNTYVKFNRRSKCAT